MKRLISVLFVAVSMLGLSAQVDLDKYETAAYLNNKVYECEGYSRTVPGKAFADGQARLMYFSDLRFKTVDNRVEFTYTMRNYSGVDERYGVNDFKCSRILSFDPGEITTITESTTNKSESLGLIMLKLNSNSGLFTERVWYYKGYYDDHDGERKVSTSEVGIIYFIADATNFTKINNALNHLIKLYKSEDDPFD
jgi:hypothetical protein